MEINDVICSFTSLCHCYPTDTFRDGTSLATGTGFKHTVTSQVFEVPAIFDAISFSIINIQHLANALIQSDSQ